MNWTLLILAGMLEVVWAIGLKYADGFTKPLQTLITISAMAASFYALSIAIRTPPLGTAYAIWVGIGAVGAAVAGFILFDESVSMPKVLSLGLIVAGIAGLKLASH